MSSSENFFKRNEKVIMVVLLALIAPTFAFTGIIAAVMGQDDPVVTTVFGEELTRSRITNAQTQMYELRRHREGLAQIGAFALQGQFQHFYQVSRDDAIEFIMWQHEADRLGIRASDEAVANEVRNLGKMLIVHHQMGKNGQVYNPTNPEERTALAQRISETRWTKAAYVAALTDPKFGKTTPKIFERQLRDGLTVGMVKQMAYNAATVAEKDIWERFCTENELRKFDILTAPTSSFEQEARESLTDDEKQAAYQKYQFKYRLNNRLQFEVAKRSFDSVKATQEEIAQRYEEDKDTLYIKTRSPNIAETPHTYFTLAERGEAVAHDVRQDKLRKLMTDFLTDATSQRDQLGAAFTLAGAIKPEEAHLFEVFTPDAIERGKEREADERIRNDPEFQTILSAFLDANVGDLSDDPIAVTDGVFVWRIVEKLPSEAAKYEDVIDKVVEDAVSDKRLELAKTKLGEWKTAIESDEAVTLETVAAEHGLKIVSPEPVNSRQFNLLKVDSKQIPGAASIVREGFQLAEAGTLTPPVSAFNKEEVYLARFAGRVDPTSEAFEQQRERLQRLVLNEKKVELLEAYTADVRARADRQDVVTRNSDEVAE